MSGVYKPNVGPPDKFMTITPLVGTCYLGLPSLAFFQNGIHIFHILNGNIRFSGCKRSFTQFSTLAKSPATLVEDGLGFRISESSTLVQTTRHLLCGIQ